MADCTSIHDKFADAEAIVKDLGLTPGMFFTDNEGNKCLYVGNTSGWRSSDKYEPLILGGNTITQIPTITFHPISHIYLYQYKNEWHMTSVEQLTLLPTQES